MAEQQTTQLFGRKYVGGAVRIGTSAEHYRDFLLGGEEVRMEFKGVRDALVFTDIRMIVVDPQGIRGKKVAIVSVPWRSITAFSVENSGKLDLDAELKVSGSGFGVCELSFAKGTDVRAVNAFLAGRILGGA